MNVSRTIAIALLIPLAAITLYALAKVGLTGIFAYQLQSPAGWQVLVDLVIALLLVLFWLVPDAQQSGRNPWPWVVATFVFGSFGPLLYLVFTGTGRTG